MGISLLAPWFGREVLGWIVDMSSIGAAIGYGYTCAATYVTLKRNPEDKKPILKIFSIIGVIISVIFVLLLIVPGMPSYLALESRICLIAWIILGLIFSKITKKSKTSR